MSLFGFGLALVALGLWHQQHDTSTRLARLEADKRPPDPVQAATARRSAQASLEAWQAQDRAERARKGLLSASEEYTDYLGAIRARVAAQNQR